MLLLLHEFVYLMRRDDFKIGLEYLRLITEATSPNLRQPI